MTRLTLFVIGLLTPAAEREWVLGDTVEEYARRERLEGPAAARRWLRGEMWRVTLHAPRHRLAAWRRVDRRPTPRRDGRLSAVQQDFRFAFRLLKRSPGFAAIAIVTLALGIGANTAIFAVVHAVLLRPLPFANPAALMLVHLTRPDYEVPTLVRESVWSYAKYQTFAGLQHTFSATALFGGRSFSVAGDGEPERIRGEVVTEDYPAILGITPLIGRSFTREEAHTPGMAPVAMIGHGLWARRFAADPAVLGRKVTLNAVEYTVIGVLPSAFRGLTGVAQIWVPLAALEPGQMKWPQSHSYYLVARRAAGVSEPAAIAAMRVLGVRIDATHRNARGPTYGATATSLSASRADPDIRQASFVLMGAVGCVLLIACVNLTNLVWARAIARRREVGVRVAIGAARGRIVRQFLAEGALLAALGAAAGLGLAWLMINTASLLMPEADVFFRTSVAPNVPRTAGAAGLTRIGAAMIGLDATTVAFTAGLAMLTALLVSLVPALQASMLHPVDALKSGGKGMTGRGRHGFSARTALVTVQIALALVLLTGAGLMIKSVAHLSATDIGIRADRVVTATVDLPAATYTNQTGAVLFDQLLERIRSAPGVIAAGLGNCPPVSGGCSSTGISFPGVARPPDGPDAMIGVYWATPDYFSTLGIRVLNGRNFTEQDRIGQPKVVLVNETAAKAYWPNESPIGKTIGVGQGGFSDGAHIVGVVSDVRYRSLDQPPMRDVYIPVAQSYQSRMRVFVRSHLDTPAVVQTIRREVHALDPNLPLSEIKSMDDLVSDAMWRTRVGAWLLSAFAALALLLTAIGIFGVMSQTVAHRTAEIGVRLALGAQRRDVLTLVFGRAALLTAAGLAIGTVSALALTRLIASLLHDVEPHDTLTFVVVALVLACVALTACYLPARRAMRVDAVVALRAE